MRALAPFAALLLGVVLPIAGCGGETSDGTGTVYSIDPERATIAPGETLTLRAGVLEPTFTSVEFAVAEGDAGGTVVPSSGGTTAVYTAPATPGTYHPRVRFLVGADAVATRTSTVTVRTGG